MGLFRKLGIVMVVTSTKWSLMAVTAPGHRHHIQLGSATICGYLIGYRQFSARSCRSVVSKTLGAIHRFRRLKWRHRIACSPRGSSRGRSPSNYQSLRVSISALTVLMTRGLILLRSRMDRSYGSR